MFLDSHCEATLGWLTPMLNRIHESRSAVVTPVIDVIDMDSFKYQGSVESVSLCAPCVVSQLLYCALITSQPDLYFYPVHFTSSNVLQDALRISWL